MMRERVGDMPGGMNARHELSAMPQRAAPLRPAAKCVAFVGPSGPVLTVAAGAIINELAAHGHAVHCFASGFDAVSTRMLKGMRAGIADLPEFSQGFTPFADRRALKQLTSAFKVLRPDVVAGYTAKGAALAGLAAKLAGVERIVAIIGELGRGFAEAPDKASGAARQFQKSLLRLAFRVSDTAIFLNEENHKLLVRHNLLPARMRQFPMNGTGIDIRQFPETPLPPLDRGVFFLFAGPLDKRLGVEEYCEAARILKTKTGHFKCLLAGPEMSGPHAMTLAELKEYRDVVQYLGPQADPRPYMARAHAIVLPARGDAIPHALIEGLAMARPVITSTARGCRVVVSEGKNGLLVAPGDAHALAGAMVRLLRRPDLIPSMARASRELAENQFDSQRINTQFLAALGL